MAFTLLFFAVYYVDCIAVVSSLPWNTNLTPELQSYLLIFNAYIALLNLTIIGWIYWLSLARESTESAAEIKENYSVVKPNIVSIKIGFALITAFAFFIMCIKTDWNFLLNPRVAYQTQRSGIGPIWALYITGLSILFLIHNVFGKINLTKFLVFIILFYFTGSKFLVVNCGVCSLVLFSFGTGRAKFLRLTVVLGFAFLVFLVLFGQIFSPEGLFSLFDRLGRYFQQTNNSARVFEEYLSGNFEFFSGEILGTRLWGSIPRAVYPDKPWAYGSAMLTEHYFPGLPAKGVGLSFGVTTYEFADFWIFGPLITILVNIMKIIKIIGWCWVSVLGLGNRSPFFIFVLLFLLTPGFGFHLPIVMTVLIGWFVSQFCVRKNVHKQNES